MSRPFRILATVISALMLPFGIQPAVAQEGTATLEGRAQATVIDPTRLIAIEDLRFGDIMQPATSGTITIGTNDSISATGGAVVGITTPQTGTRGAGRFSVTGEPRRMFVVLGLGNATITNGTATMRVSKLRTNIVQGTGRFDRNGKYLLKIGGELTIDAMQSTGEYSGTYDVTVLYL